MLNGTLFAVLPLRDWGRIKSTGETAATLLAGM